MKFKRTLAAALVLLFALAAIVQAQPIRAAMVWGLMTARGNTGAFFKAVHENGGNCVRFFVNYLEDDCEEPSPLPPFVTAGTWNPEHIAYGTAGHVLPIRDLSVRNPAWTARAEAIAALCVKYEIAPWVVFDDQCSQCEGWRMYNDSYYGSIQLHPGWAGGSLDRAFGGGNQALELNPYREALERDTLAIFKTAGCPLVYGEPMNEYGMEPGPAYSLEDELHWYELRAASLKSLGYDLVLGSARPPITTLISGYVDRYDVHCIVTPTDLAALNLGLPNDRVIVDTDGGMGAGKVSATGARTLTAAQATTLGAAVKAGNFGGWCLIFQEATDSLTLPENLDAVDYAPLRAFAEATGWSPVEYVSVLVCKETGMLPTKYCPETETRQFVKGQEPHEVCNIHGEPVTPPPPKPKSWFQKLLDFLFGWLK
jgi:hypothetical protein